MHICCLTRITLGHAIKGGMEVHIDMLSQALVERGHEVSIVTTSHANGVEEATDGGVTTYYLDGCRPGRYSHEWGRATPGFLRALHERRPIDLVWGEGAGAFYYIKWARNPLSLPIVTHLQGTYLGELGTFLSLARFEGKWWQFVRFFAWRTIQYFRWDLWYTRGADAVIGASNENAALARRCYFLPKSRVTASVNGVDVERFRPDPEAGQRVRQNLGLEPDAPILFHCSRLEPEKGAQYSLRAFAAISDKHPSARLVIAGDGIQRDLIPRLAEELGVADLIRVLDHIPNEQLPAYYNACSVFLCPTVAVESFGITVAEAMACGRPVVAFRRGGIQTSIDNGDNGLMVPAGNVDALVHAIDALLVDPALAAEIGTAARSKAVAALSVERMVEVVDSVFEERVAEHDR